ncbi:MAG: ATP-dependent Clp protease adaptor ClpS [Prevotella pectinovora]|jgi:ATP-dependent Clp protease adaptor protein ClpS|uniref:ATP-dependent Clp protease adapter protein ClpS n=2 Tax=Prevotellaceae TaxID=171552 RepID=A0A0D0J046_9BACT|nr:ATP-dependent Clp protease adaptor ClpS [Prevotella pectinovora]KIP59560.1 Clp protease ClpS [Prevotella pectinovora]KIP61734.1 Clp protease ClpS [Prevotella pectinovora]KIP62712.1 Clp protease ClpS [Prevotella pectinovora]MDD7743346.1 ATP-dependent Clp protease adaptor ClpS [Prevotella pectinovora]
MPQQQSDIRQKTRYKKPRMYKVTMHNDNITTMEFVIKVLIEIFHRTPDDAEQLMLKIHHEGSAMIGVYTYDMARTKVRTVTLMAQEKGFPLKTTYEPE